MRFNKGIRLDMDEYKSPNKSKGMSEQEKLERLYTLARKMNIQIGGENNCHDENARFLPYRS